MHAAVEMMVKVVVVKVAVVKVDVVDAAGIVVVVQREECQRRHGQQKKQWI